MPSFAALIAPNMPNHGLAVSGSTSVESSEAENPFGAILTSLADEDAETAQVATDEAQNPAPVAPMAFVPQALVIAPAPLAPEVSATASEPKDAPATLSPVQTPDLQGQQDALAAPDLAPHIDEAKSATPSQPSNTLNAATNTPDLNEGDASQKATPQELASPTGTMSNEAVKGLLDQGLEREPQQAQAQSARTEALTADTPKTDTQALKAQGDLERAHLTARDTTAPSQPPLNRAPQAGDRLADYTPATPRPKAHDPVQSDSEKTDAPNASTPPTDNPATPKTATYSFAASLQAQLQGQAKGQPVQTDLEAALTPQASTSDMAALEPGDSGQGLSTTSTSQTVTSQGPNTSPLSGLAKATIETTAQISAQILRKLEGRATRFDMILTPESLGRVDVSLTVESDGQVTARLAFDNPAAATDLRGRADELRRQLAESGLNLSRENLEFSDRNSQSGSNGSGFARDQDRRAFAGTARLIQDADLALLPLTSPWTSPSQTPDRVDVKV